MLPAVSVRLTMADLAAAELPAWVRVGCLAWALADPSGHARLTTGQLSTALGISPSATSNALGVARERGWIDDCSTARCVVLPGCGPARCEERHR